MAEEEYYDDDLENKHRLRRPCVRQALLPRYRQRGKRLFRIEYPVQPKQPNIINVRVRPVVDRAFDLGNSEFPGVSEIRAYVGKLIEEAIDELERGTAPDESD